MSKIGPKELQRRALREGQKRPKERVKGGNGAKPRAKGSKRPVARPVSVPDGDVAKELAVLKRRRAYMREYMRLYMQRRRKAEREKQV